MKSHDLGRFASSVLVLLLVAVGTPIGLVAVSTRRFGSGNPLAGVQPPWMWGQSDIGAAISEPVADATVIDALVRLSLCVVWVAVAVILITTVGEFLHAVRHRGLPLPDVRGLGWVQGMARFIVVGLVTVLPLATPTASLASTLQARSVATSTAAPPPDTDATRVVTAEIAPPGGSIAEHPSIPVRSSSTTHVVRAGESIYSIAVDLAGSDTGRVIEIADSIIDANLGSAMPSGQRFTNPAYIEVGWAVALPAEVVVDSEVGIDRYVVERGDTLWDIADEHLGDPTAWPEIWEANAGDEMRDGRTFDDPNLILPGWELDVAGEADGPAFVDRSPVEVAEPVEATDETDQQSGPDTEVADWMDNVAVDAPADTFASAPSAAPAPPGPAEDTASSLPAMTSTTVPMDGRDAGADDLTGATPAPEAPSPIRLEHAALLAAGLLALVGVRRRQRLRAAMPRHRVPEPHPDVAATERRLRSVGAGERALRVDVACRAAAWTLIGADSQIGWVLASTDGAIELRLTAAATLPAPWVGEGQAWRLGAEVPVELLSEDARKVGQPCVALVQLGVTEEGDDVIVDLEAAGHLSVVAGTRHADEIVTAIAASLASSVFAEVAHLIGVSVPSSALLEHRNAHVTESSDAAFELAMALTGTTTSQERTAFELRSLRTGGEAWEPAVVLLCAADLVGSDVDAAHVGHGVGTAGHGLAIVAADAQRQFGEGGALLVGSADGWLLEGFGAEIALTPIGVTDADMTEIAELLADASREPEPVDADPIVGLRWADDPSPPGGHSPAAVDAASNHRRDGTEHEQAREPERVAPFEPQPHEIVVGLLGTVEVTDRVGTPGSFERSKTVELIAWLATHRDRATRSGARTALWEMDVRDATFANVVSEARRKLARLVTPPAGEEWVARTLTEQLPLHDLVVTDADLVEERLAHARVQPPSQAIEILRPAVESVRGMPFTGSGYLWPDAEGLTSNLVMLAITATAEFAAHALSLGDTEGVFWATGHGLRVLSGHEELISLRMQAHARLGDLAGLRQEWESYERVLVADAWSDGEPAPHLLALRRELLNPAAS